MNVFFLLPVLFPKQPFSLGIVQPYQLRQREKTNLTYCGYAKIVQFRFAKDFYQEKYYGSHSCFTR